MKPGLRTLIEQAIARGWTTTRIMADLSVPYSAVRDVRDGMTDDPHGCGTDVSPTVLTVGGRPLSSYFGPADPSVIEALIDALFPSYSRRAKKAA